MKINRPAGIHSDVSGSRAKLLTLCFFFVLGVIAAYLFRRFVTDSDNSVLQQYVYAYMESASKDSARTPGIFTVLDMYMRYPIAVYLLGFTAGGILLVPLLLVLQGLSLSFSVLCFCAALGRSGLYLALAAFGIRSAFVLPITMLLAGHALSRSAKLRRPPPKGKEKRTQPKNEILQLICCVAILFVGVALELILVPRLLISALNTI